MSEVAEKPQEVVAPTTEEAAAPVSTAAVSKLEADVIRQIEYYFGDANLSRDKFLLEQVKKTEAGWVTFETLLTFKRLAALTTNVEEIVAALAKSDEGLVEVSEDKLSVRRHPERPIPEQNEELRKETVTRTAYCKGFPLEAELDEIIEFFAPYDKVVNITMRKYLDKPTKTYKFKGSVFVTFAKKEQVEEFVAKDKVVFKERELIRKSQESYLEEKREERKKTQKNKVKEEEPKFQLPKGTVLHFEGATEDTTRELIREAVEALEGEVAFIDFSKGNKEGQVRLQAENAAAPFLEKLAENKLKLKDEVELTLRLLSEEEEATFLQKAVEQMKSRRNQQSRGRNNHHHNNRKRGGSRRGDDGPRSKASKDE